jgi:hypothetical protein
LALPPRDNRELVPIGKKNMTSCGAMNPSSSVVVGLTIPVAYQ